MKKNGSSKQILNIFKIPRQNSLNKVERKLNTSGLYNSPHLFYLKSAVLKWFVFMFRFEWRGGGGFLSTFYTRNRKKIFKVWLKGFKYSKIGDGTSEIMVHMVIVEPARDLAVCQCCLHYSLPFDVYHISHVMHSENVWGRHGSQSTLNLQQNKSASWVCSWSFSEFLDFTSTCCQLSHVTTKHLPLLFGSAEKAELLLICGAPQCAPARHMKGSTMYIHDQHTLQAVLANAQPPLSLDHT